LQLQSENITNTLYLIKNKFKCKTKPTVVNILYRRNEKFMKHTLTEICVTKISKFFWNYKTGKRNGMERTTNTCDSVLNIEEAFLKTATHAKNI